MKAEIDMTTHSCSYYCDNPPCIKAQRDEMRAEMEAMQAKLAKVEALLVENEALQFTYNEEIEYALRGEE